MKKPTKIELAYMTGFIDGEGCISITKTKRRKNSSWHYCMSVIVCCIDLNPLYYIQKFYGGSIHKHRGKPQWKGSYQLRIGMENSHRLLKDIRQFLIVKDAQANTALEFMELKLNYPRKKGQRNPEAYTENLEVLKLEMNELNKRGV